MPVLIFAYKIRRWRCSFARARFHRGAAFSDAEFSGGEASFSGASFLGAVARFEGARFAKGAEFNAIYDAYSIKSAVVTS